MKRHRRFNYSPIVDRKKLRFPNGARVAVWLVPNIEHFHFDKPATSATPVTMQFKPDVLNYAWRDYGVRVGIWRMMEVMDRHGFKGTVALNSDVCGEYPRIIKAGNELGWEWMAHGRTNSEMFSHQTADEERAIIKIAVDTIRKGTGKRPRGWLSPALTETYNTPDILAENGIRYLCDWCNDEQPFPMKVKKGRLISVPYSVEVNDIPAFIDRGMTGEQFYQLIVDQFDVLYEDGASTGRVMAICLHPFLTGHPFRAKYLDKALKYIAGRNEVWITRGGDIADWYYANHMK